MYIFREHKKSLQNGVIYDAKFCFNDSHCMDVDFIIDDIERHIERYLNNLPISNRNTENMLVFEFDFGSCYNFDAVELLAIETFLFDYCYSNDWAEKYNEDYPIRSFVFFKNNSGFLAKYNIKQSECHHYNKALDVFEDLISNYFEFLPSRHRDRVENIDLFIELQREEYKYIKANISYLYYDETEKQYLDIFFRYIEKAIKFAKVDEEN